MQSTHPLTGGPRPGRMNELSNVLQEVLKALGIEGVETIGLHRGAELGDHHHGPSAGEAGGA